MADFSLTSNGRLETCVEPIQRLMNEVVKTYDCTILEGERSIQQQRENVAKGVSKTMDSKHLVTPEKPKARAVDAAPFPLKWPKRNEVTYTKDLARYYYFGGFVLATAERLGIKIRWGGDWDGDRDIHEQDFDDLVHFEVIE